jgi:hypothetical protein
VRTVNGVRSGYFPIDVAEIVARFVLYRPQGGQPPMHEQEPAADHPPPLQVCTRCATHAKGFDVRVGTTGGYVATRYPL